MSLIVALLVTFAGLAVGATSIGGILVVPALTAAGGVPVREAVAAANFSFIFTGLAPLLTGRFSSAVPPAEAHRVHRWPLNLAALAGAAFGAFTLQWLPGALMRGAVAVLAVVSGVMALRGGRGIEAAAAGRTAGLSPIAQVVLGALVGCGSAWSGTGGPVLLLPLLIFLAVPTRLAVDLGQGIQLPIACAATVVNLASGALDLRLGLLLGACLSVGWVAGYLLQRRISTRLLAHLLAGGLIVVGLWYGWQTVLQ
jgi:hypothetical protein